MSYVVYGHFGGWNVGDEVIARSMVGLLRQRQPGAAISLLCSSYRDSSVKAEYQDYGAEPLELRTAGALKALRQRRLIAGGGQMLTGDVSRKGLILLLGLVVVNRLSGHRPLLLFAGAQGIEGRKARVLVRMIGQVAHMCVVRDEPSLAALEASGLAASKQLLAADVVFSGAAFPNLDDPTMGQIESKQVLVVGHRSPLRTYVSAEQLGLIIRSILDIDPDLSVALLSHDCRPLLDNGLVSAFAESELDRKVSLLSMTDTDTALSAYRDAAVVVSVRMHPLIIGTVMGLPVVGIRASSKVDALSEQLDFPLMDPDDPSAIARLVADQLAEPKPADWETLRGRVEKALDALIPIELEGSLR